MKMSNREQLKKLGGVFRLLGDLGVLADCPRLRAFLNDEVQRLVRQVEGGSPKSVVEESLWLLVENGWRVHIRRNDVDSYTAETRNTRGGNFQLAECHTMSEALESLVRDIFPLEAAKRLRRNK